MILTYLKNGIGEHKVNVFQKYAHNLTVVHVGHSQELLLLLTEHASKTQNLRDWFFPQKTKYCVIPTTLVVMEELFTILGSINYPLELLMMLVLHIHSKELHKITQFTITSAQLLAKIVVHILIE